MASGGRRAPAASRCAPGPADTLTRAVERMFRTTPRQREMFLAGFGERKSREIGRALDGAGPLGEGLPPAK